MAQSGTVELFHAKSGFGFIAPKKGGDKVFVHWKEIQSDDRWPRLDVGMEVKFQTTTGEDGRVKATNVTKSNGKKITCAPTIKVLSEGRVTGVVKMFRFSQGFGFVELTKDYSAGKVKLAKGTDVYISREELNTDSENPIVARGMEVEFKIAEQSSEAGKYCGCDVTLPGGGIIPRTQVDEVRAELKAQVIAAKEAKGESTEKPKPKAKAGKKK